MRDVFWNVEHFMTLLRRILRGVSVRRSISGRKPLPLPRVRDILRLTNTFSLMTSKVKTLSAYVYFCKITGRAGYRRQLRILPAAAHEQRDPTD